MIIYLLKIKIIIKGINIIIRNKKVKEKVRFDYLLPKKGINIIIIINKKVKEKVRFDYLLPKN